MKLEQQLQIGLQQSRLMSEFDDYVWMFFVASANRNRLVKGITLSRTLNRNPLSIQRSRVDNSLLLREGNELIWKSQPLSEWDWKIYSLFCCYQTKMEVFILVQILFLLARLSVMIAVGLCFQSLLQQCRP